MNKNKTTQKEEKFNKFFEDMKEHLVKVSDNDDSFFSYCWSDYSALKKFMQNNDKGCKKKYFIMTLIAEGDNMYITNGYHIIGRIAYILADKEYELLKNENIEI